MAQWYFEKVIEFKIQEPGKTWEQTKIHQVLSCKVETADSVARELSRDYKAQIRWNIQGLNQGHYVSNYQD